MSCNDCEHGGAFPATPASMGFEPFMTSARQPGFPSALAPTRGTVVVAPDASGWSAAGGDGVDFSHAQFRVGGSTKISDLLVALPKVRARFALGSYAAATPTLAVQVSRADAIPTVSPYDLTTASVTDAAKTIATTQSFPIFRYGGRVKVLSIDEGTTPPSSAQNYALYNRAVAATGVLTTLDKYVAQGNGTTNLKGLAAICSENGRTTATTTSVTKDIRAIVRQITTSEGGVGAGIQCLIGGLRMRQTLMAETGGLQAPSGFYWDRVTQRNTYHWGGIPFYLTETDESGATAPLYGANLGPCGLQLVYLVGTAESLGLTVEETPVTGATGAREYTVHGAWALVCFEKEALYEVTGITLAA